MSVILASLYDVLGKAGAKTRVRAVDVTACFLVPVQARKTQGGIGKMRSACLAAVSWGW